MCVCVHCCLRVHCSLFCLPARLSVPQKKQSTSINSCTSSVYELWQAVLYYIDLSLLLRTSQKHFSSDLTNPIRIKARKGAMPHINKKKKLYASLIMKLSIDHFAFNSSKEVRAVQKLRVRSTSYAVSSNYFLECGLAPLHMTFFSFEKIIHSPY